MKTSVLLAALLAALSLSACGGSGSSSSAVCDEYEKAFAEATKDVDAATKEMMQKSFEQTKEALKNLPADQRDATCKTSLDALKGVPAAETPEEKAEEAKDAAEEAKEEAKDAAEDAKEAAEDAKEEAK
ncbi:hypothetical protein CYJ99_03975 [Neisseria perflava]|jgi:hypothetical protein|uniref:DUF5339 family protein n=1 Tax=Neisseria perflava TaxID=33053 RepID=A0A9X7I5X6_NEIPE|nr:DUF5339 family protein [Neisseria perflava]PLA50250.1 hypothetical protein CYJ99_03975 [Neisseria perflava]WOS98914.1 DUF5339 family protein [Neisseria perflava]